MSKLLEAETYSAAVVHNFIRSRDPHLFETKSSLLYEVSVSLACFQMPLHFMGAPLYLRVNTRPANSLLLYRHARIFWFLGRLRLFNLRKIEVVLSNFRTLSLFGRLFIRRLVRTIHYLFEVFEDVVIS